MGLYVMSRKEMGHCRRMENGSADSCLSVLDDQEKGLVDRENVIVIKNDKEKINGFCLHSCSSDSSIGKNSDEGVDNVNDDDDDEVQSSFNEGKDGAFGCFQTMEGALPIRKGLSNFYDGMSKSYPRLDEASASWSIKAIAKPENLYSRKRKISLAMGEWMSGGKHTLSSFSPHYSRKRQTKFNSSCHTFYYGDSEQCASLEASAPLGFTLLEQRESYSNILS